MHTGTLSFCDKWALNIKSHEVKDQIMKELEHRYRVRAIAKHHIRFDTPVVPQLQAHPHMVCLRSNGNPYWLYLSRYNFANQCFFIDKKIQTGYHSGRIVISKLRFAEELYDGTLFEGEMVRDKDGHWVFLLHDIIAYRGQWLEKEPFLRRLQRLYGLLETQFRPDDTDVCHLQVKRYVTYDEMSALVRDFMPTLPYTCRSLYFKPMSLRHTDILYNFDESQIKKVERVKYQKEAGTGFLLSPTDLASTPAPTTTAPPPSSTKTAPSLQWKVPGLNGPSKAFYMEKTHMVDVYNIYDAKTKQWIGHPHIASLLMSKQLQALFEKINVSTRLPVQCQFHEGFKKWVPVSA